MSPDGRSYSKSEACMSGVRNAECGMSGRAPNGCDALRTWPINSAFRIPHSASTLEDRRLLCALGRWEAKVLVRARCGAAAARCAGEEALLHQERLVHLLERPGIFAHGGRHGRYTHRAALELLDDRLEDARIHVVEPELVHVEPLERLRRDASGDLAVRA